MNDNDFSGRWAMAASLSAAVLLLQGLAIGTVPASWFALKEGFEWSRSDTSLALALGMLPATVAPIVMGRILDIVRPKKTILLVCLFAGIGLLLTAFVSKTWQFSLLIGVVRFAIAGAAYISLFALLLAWFPKNSGRIIGFILLLLGFGETFTAAVNNFLVDSYGWRSSFASAGAALLILAVPLVLFTIRDVPESGAKEGEIEKKSGGGWRLFFLLAAGMFLAGVVSESGQTDLITSRTNSQEASALLVSSIKGFSGLGALLFGIVADRWNSRKAFVTAAVVAAFSLLMRSALEPLWAQVSFIFLIRSCQMGFLVLLPLLVASFYRMSNFGLLCGLLLVINGMGTSFGGGFFSWTMHNHGSKYYLTLLAGALIALLSGYSIYHAARFVSPISDEN